VGEDVAEFSDDAVGGDDRLVGLEAILRALVDVKDAGEIVSAGADDLGCDCGGDIVLLEVEDGLEAVALDGIFGEGSLLEAEAGDLLLKIVVLLARVAEVNVVGPSVAEVVAEGVEEALKGSDNGDGPIANEGDAAAIGSSGFDWAADLDGEADGLGEQDRDQNQNIFEACEERFHWSKMIIFELARGRR
jgi:hypothetical protein